MRITRLSSIVFVPLLGLSQGASAGLWDGSTASVLSRNFFLHNDYRHDDVRDKSYQQEWAQGFIGRYSSGFTPGIVGVGVDAHGFLGVRLDSGRGTSGTGLLPVDSDGRAEPEYSSAGLALKLRAGDTLLKIGEMEVETPVFDTADKRLQPEYATGALLQSTAIPGMTWVAGRFNAFKNQAQSSSHGDFEGYGANTRGRSISLAGVRTPAGAPWGGALYASKLDDTWRQYYGNLNHTQALGADTSLFLDANLYRTLDTGSASAGDIATTASSLLGRLRSGGQAFSLGYQKIHGDTPFDFVGGDSIYLANSIKYTDFNGANEQSWQLRYDLDLKQVLPGLSLMARYVRGSQIDGSKTPAGGAWNLFDDSVQGYRPSQGKGGKHWERDVALAWTVPSGPARDLTVNLSHVSHRGNAAQGNNDLDRVYLVVEYPFDLMRARP
ncbi:OprD family porin [Pseudomonas sp. JDS28PS106]|uniref:OprD family porin n=1 Tax=Pseudomonas sp. JDS28PS106 TaxID=2497235 RepID=UPI002FD6320A